VTLKSVHTQVQEFYAVSRIGGGSGRSVKTLAAWFPTDKIPLGSHRNQARYPGYLLAPLGGLPALTAPPHPTGGPLRRAGQQTGVSAECHGSAPGGAGAGKW